MEVGGINVPPMSRDGNITQPLSVLDLQIDQRYNICVTAKNFIGHSSPGCNGSYIYMEIEGTYVFSISCFPPFYYSPINSLSSFLIQNKTLIPPHAGAEQNFSISSAIAISATVVIVLLAVMIIPGILIYFCFKKKKVKDTDTNQ